MGSVRIIVSTVFATKSSKANIKLPLEIRVEVVKEKVFYLSQVSVEAADIKYVAGRKEIVFEDPKVASQLNDQAFSDIAALINADIDSGKYDEEIKKRFKKSKTPVLVTGADVAAGRHRASPNNTKKDHNWVPNSTAKSGTTIPKFIVRDAGTGRKLGEYTSINEACTGIGDLNSGNVRQCLTNDRAVCDGYSFEFVDPTSEEVVFWIEENKLKKAA